MEIASLTESIIEYLLISSTLLLILGLLSFLSIQSLKVQGKAKLWICTLLVILPLAYPLKTFFPEAIKIQVPLESDYFQQHNKIDAEKTVTTNRSFIADNPEAAVKAQNSETILSESEAPFHGIKNLFMGNFSTFIGNWKLIASIIWGGVFFYFLIHIVTTGYKTSRLLRLADPVTNPEILKLFHQCVTQTGLRHTPQLFMVEGIPTPMVMGFLKPGIIIPCHLIKTELREGLRFTLLHELKHLQQHHNLWLLIESLIGAAYFFHPVFHWAKNRIHEELENICDRHVTHVTDNSVSYADFLLNQIWQQSSGRTPALALPFISTVSKTTNRIHSILENAGPTTFMQIRDSVSALMVLMAFPLVLLLSIAPSVPHSDQALNVLSKLNINTQEKESYKDELLEKENKVTLIDQSSRRLSDKTPSHIEKYVPAVKTKDSTDSQNNVVLEKTTFEPALETKSPLISIADEEHKTEITQESPLPNTIQDHDFLERVTVNNMISIQNAPEMREVSKESPSPVTFVEKYLGTPVNELSINRIDNIRALDEYTVLFIMRGENIYLTRLSVPCPSLLHATDFNLGSNLGKLSNYDSIQTISFGQILGTTGTVGPIYPYKYKGNKYEAIKLLKNNLLAALVKEGAFED